MIRLHKLNDQEVVVNAELIETVEAHGAETVVALATGNKYVVKEPVAEIIERVAEYKKTVFVGASYLPEYLRGEGRKKPCP
jgi:flagellar protein FlbD